MAILIEGMEMPTTCGSCWFCHAVSNEKWHCRLTGKSFASYSVGWGNENNTGENGQRPYIRRDDCPLIEVPEPNGRLGDLDKLEQMFVDIDNAPYSGFDGTEPFYSAEDAAQIIRLAPTIIPASEEGET